MWQISLALGLGFLTTHAYCLNIEETHSNLIECATKGSLWSNCQSNNGSANLILFPENQYQSDVEISYNLACDPGSTEPSGYVIEHQNIKNSIPFSQSSTLNYNDTSSEIRLFLVDPMLLDFYQFQPGCDLSISVRVKTPSENLASSWRTEHQRLGREIKSLEDAIQGWQVASEYSEMILTLENTMDLVMIEDFGPTDVLLEEQISQAKEVLTTLIKDHSAAFAAEDMLSLSKLLLALNDINGFTPIEVGKSIANYLDKEDLNTLEQVFENTHNSNISKKIESAVENKIELEARHSIIEGLLNQFNVQY